MSELDPDAVAGFLTRVIDSDPTVAAYALDDAMNDLSALGLPPGGVVVLALSNGTPLVTLYFAALLLGLVPLAISPATPASRVAGLTKRIGAHALVAGRLTAARYGAVATHRIGPAQAVVLDSRRDSDFSPGEVLMLTSNTSGTFSVCVHRIDSLLRNAGWHARAVRLRGNDVVLVTLPLHYSYALVAQMLAGLVSGAGLVVSGPPFSVASYLSSLRTHGVTSSSVTPTIARRLIAYDDRFPPSLVALTVGGDRISPDHVARLLSLNPSGELYLTYGLTEAGPRVSTLAAHIEPPARHSSVGLPLPGVRAHIRGGTDEGELLIESDTALIRKIGAARPAPRPGVVATGDLFHIDDDGYLYFRGRLSDFVIVRGEKVSLSAVRQAAHAIPGVLTCTPAVETTEDGEVHVDLHLAVAHRDPATEREVRRRLNSSLLPSERPRHIVFAGPDSPDFRK